MRAAERVRPLGGGVALALALAALAPTLARAQGTLVTDVTIVHDGLTRYFDHYVPAGLPAAAVPLLVVLHGGTQSNKAIEAEPMGEFRGLADAEKFVVVFPNGTSSSTGQSGPSGSFNWNDCRNDAGPAATTADDVGFVAALLDWASANFGIDTERVYVTGPSNGGLMAYRLAFELSDRIAAVAAVIADLPVNSECPAQPANAIPVLIMNGMADPIMPWGGGQVAGNRGLVASALATRDFWRTFLHTGATPQHGDFPDLDPNDGGTVSKDIYVGGTEGSEVAFYAVGGAGHEIPSIAHRASAAVEQLFGKQNHDLEAALEIWGFLERHRLHGSGCG